MIVKESFSKNIKIIIKSKIYSLASSGGISLDSSTKTHGHEQKLYIDMLAVT